MTIDEKLARLRGAMAGAGLDAYLIVTSDPHCGEYIPDDWQTVAFFTGFTGENATLIVTQSEAALWVDGRFFVQGDKQTAGSSVQVMKMQNPGVPKRQDWLAERLQAGQVCGFEGFATPCTVVEDFTKKDIAMKSCPLANTLWEDRPERTCTPAWLLPENVCGQGPAVRLALVREQLQKAGADALLTGALDQVAWLLNLRANDIRCVPYATAFCLVLPGSCLLFMDNPLPDAGRAALAGAGVEVLPYGELVPRLAACTEKLTLLADKKSLNYDIAAALRTNPAVTARDGESPIRMLKAVKTPEELASDRNAHIKDGTAMVRFWMDLEAALAAGHTLTEPDIERMLQKRRGEQDGYLMDSFDTIAAYGPNAAMMHYHADQAHYSTIQPRGFLLVDTGGQYLDGTTDITRTYQVGPLTDQERDLYTWVLQSHICLAKAVFLNSCTCSAVDTFARGPLWGHLLNYRCGTGHGVAFVGSVHEGPQSLRGGNNVVLRPGMIVTDEPGVYETDWLGIRTENELVCVEKATNQYGTFLGFEPLTFVPYDLRPLKKELLNRDEIEWLNRYHQTVYDTLAPQLTEAERRFLREKTKPV